MKRGVPVVYNDRDTFLHRRDPRVKLLLFVMLMTMLYLTPSWQWMLGLLILGAIMSAIARVPPLWLAVLLAFQIPQMTTYLAVPALTRMAAGHGAFAGGFDFALKVSLSWPAAVLVSLSIFTTMRLSEIGDGLRGLGVPEVAVFTFEYTILLFYLTLSDFWRIVDAVKLKGVHVETRNPLRLVKGIPQVAIQMLFSVLRRSKTMMAVMKMRGYSFSSTQREHRTEFSFDRLDAALLLLAVSVVSVTAGVRFEVLALPTHPLPIG